MYICATGHRPQKLGYGANVFKRLTSLAEAIIRKHDPEVVISGMALGWDQAMAQAAINLHVPFIAAVPFPSYAQMWPDKEWRYYANLLLDAAGVSVISSGVYTPQKMQIRNEWMVDHSDLVIALWNGTQGGTYNCIKYARSVGKPVYNYWQSWVKHA